MVVFHIEEASLEYTVSKMPLPVSSVMEKQRAILNGVLFNEAL